MFGRKKPEPAQEEIIVKVEEPVAEPEPVVEVKKEVKPAGTFIAEGVTLVGNFETSDDFEIKGTVRGMVISTNTMHIDSTGALYGDAKVKNLYVDGEVEGSVIVEKASVISESGRLKGNLATATFQTDPGSYFDGALKLEVPKKAPEPAPVYEVSAENAAASEPQAEEDLSNISLE